RHPRPPPRLASSGLFRSPRREMPREGVRVERREVESPGGLVDQLRRVGARVVVQLIVDPLHGLLDRRFAGAHRVGSWLTAALLAGGWPQYIARFCRVPTVHDWLAPVPANWRLTRARGRPKWLACTFRSIATRRSRSRGRSRPTSSA